MLVTYDVNVSSPGGQKRLRNVSKICLDYGIRVQHSVLECEVDPAQFLLLKNHLTNAFNAEKDSLRFYFLGKKGRSKVEHLGAKPSLDLLRDTIVI